MTYLSDQQLNTVRTFLPLYLEGQTRIGVPWAMLAALHYRESDLGTSTARVGGPLQFDPPIQPEQVRAWGLKYGIADLGSPETDLRTAVLCAACFLQVKAAVLGKALKSDSSLGDIADVAWSYNGRAYGSWKNSPYVSNDPQNGVQLRLTGTVPDIHDPSKRVRIDKIETRPGVLPVMRELLSRVPLPAPVVVSVPAAPAGPRLLLADRTGAFGEAVLDRFIYHGLMFARQPSGDWWVRPAEPNELN